MSFYNYYVTAFKTRLFGGKTKDGEPIPPKTPGSAFIWTGYYISAQGCNFIKAQKESNISKHSDNDGLLSLNYLTTNSDNPILVNIAKQLSFLKFSGWEDASWLKRLLLLLSWSFSIPFVITSSLLHALGSGFGVLSESENVVALLWAKICMIPSLMLVGIYRQMFDFSGRYPLKQAFFTFLAALFVFTPVLHSALGIALSGATIGGLALGGLPIILIITGVLLFAFSLRFAFTLDENEQKELEKFQYQEAENKLKIKALKDAEEKLDRIKTEIARLTGFTGDLKKEIIKNLTIGLGNLDDEVFINNEIFFNKLINTESMIYLLKNLTKLFNDATFKHLVDQLRIAEVQKRNLAPTEQLKFRQLQVKYYSPLFTTLGMVSFALGLIGLLFIKSYAVPIVLIALPYSVPLLIIITAVLALLIYKNVEPGFFSATPARKLMTALAIITVALIIAVALPPIPLLLTTTGFTLSAIKIFLGLAAAVMAITTMVFYKIKIEYQEQTMFPKIIKCPIVGQPNVYYLLERVGAPFGRVYYEKIGIEKTDQETNITYQAKLTKNKFFYDLTPSNGEPIPDISKNTLMRKPYFFTAHQLDCDIQFSAAVLYNVQGSNQTLALDGTLPPSLKITSTVNQKQAEAEISCIQGQVKVVIKSEKKRLTIKQAKNYLKNCGFNEKKINMLFNGSFSKIKSKYKKEASITISWTSKLTLVDVFIEDEREELTKEAAIAYLKGNGFTNEPGMEKIEQLGVYVAKLVQFDPSDSNLGKQVELANEEQWSVVPNSAPRSSHQRFIDSSIGRKDLIKEPIDGKKELKQVVNDLKISRSGSSESLFSRSSPKRQLPLDQHLTRPRSSSL